MLNRVVLTGRLTRDPELRYTGSGTAVCSFTVAVDRQFRNQNGDRDADFISCVIWRKSAENFANFTHKGSLVGIDGRLSTRNYENNQGQRVYVTEVTVDNFALLEPRSSNQGNNGGFNNNQNFNQNNAFNNNNNGGNFGNQNPSQPAANNNQPVFNQDNQVDLSTLPFNNEDSSNDNGINIDDNSAMSTNNNKDKDNSSDNDGDQPSIDDVPF
ncbi:MAG: single-stranded DNA-binding protein [Limosilactobacillus coleohominis]|jgi:single-strand DNA-binding protein|uniref:single-stranded DNA-binding protein n=1 Tax=Limosilactobacillus coleohominis TaxID=181675 RepID=UPI0015BB8269|nr:single-stranded DNA-binding protein [Limosilactobacillus coleohominis]MCI5812637.1 single-stranded DNA-binding protein [Lactobacillus sp.]MDY3702980.1 single-stranded DNA-binding protein [Limosilactobacillus coleohominis]MDY5629434.1 single-stranded DNA-binding protein [Limosilactobacillus coleohominis]HJA23354.1 single-stranded DNA-binding protein [Candidatus Limosilactobacillus intestinavium]